MKRHTFHGFMGYLAGKLAEALRSRQPELNITERDVLCVQIAGLCHDLGHGPFSHLYDGLFLPKALEKKRKLKKWKHEKGSCDMLDHLLKENNLEPVMEKYKLIPEEDITFIKEMIAGPLQESEGQEWPYKGRPEKKSFLYEIVSNKKNGVDVDKFDYLARDSLYLGIMNNFDFRRFLQFARVCEVDGRKTICTRDKEEDHMYHLFYTRHRLHKRACQHRVSHIIQEMIAEAFLKADDHTEIEGSGGSMFTLSTANEDMEAYTKLTDNVFEEILNSSEPNLQESRQILQNIISRKIYKFVGETTPKNPIPDWKSLKSSWKTKLAQPLPEGGRYLTRKDFKILVIERDYGMDDKDPIQHVHFYSKSDLNKAKAKAMPEEKESKIGTKIFSEQLIRVFCKKIDDESVKAAKKHFKQWLRMEPNLDGPEGN
ncbi:deoxynucleoside triphosphate triphosphohydrolase SAMHD1-like [Labrus bergylta]|uniref:deoxynucleoside triphosphate triphosphohydrolase SAMHD1-like n=1 Tax=Labrus bergylta TaxID=56723 RepID=UPI003314091D